MTIKEIDPRDFDQKAGQIKAEAVAVLTKWGLAPRFKRWRLTQDRATGMIVLFGILNNEYIAAQTSIPFGNYFDPHLLRDLANEVQVQVVSCNSDEDLHYAFILDRGSFGKLPTHVDYPIVDKGKPLVRVVFNNEPVPVSTLDAASVGDNRFMRQVAGAFLKVFEDIKLRDDATLLLSAQDPPDIVIIDESEFTKRVAEHELNRLKVKRIKEHFDATEEK